MKQFIVFILSVFVLVGCETEIKEEIVELHSNGQVKKIQHYQMKRKTKTVIKEMEYYATGELMMEGPILKDQRNGTWKSFHANGNLWSIGLYKKGKRTGQSEVYYENGVKRIEGMYEDGNRIGLWKFYDEKGQKIKEVTFAADSVISEEDFFYGVPFN
jgi:antitoxin component YwqK of YwqJK toxin-antitoxin module